MHRASFMSADSGAGHRRPRPRDPAVDGVDDGERRIEVSRNADSQSGVEIAAAGQSHPLASDPEVTGV